MDTFVGWLKKQTELNEADTRYSVEVNYRTTMKEVLNHAAKVTLGYTSAALKKADFHVKQVFEEEPYRILVSNRNWDDGEWVCVASWNPNESCYFVSRGYYNKDRKTVSVQETKKCGSESAAQITTEIRNMMHNMKDLPDRHIQKLKKVPLKRGPRCELEPVEHL